METQRVCPITGQPLPESDQAAIISVKAQDDFRASTRHLADKVQAAQLALQQPGGGSTSEIRSLPQSKPPLNLHVLDELIDHTATIGAWALDLKPPNTYLMRDDWATIQAIYQSADLIHYEPAPDLIHQVGYALRRLTLLAEPPGIPDLYGPALTHAYDQLKNSWLTISAACQAVEHYTGQRLPRSTVDSWIRTRKIQSDGEPRKVLVSDLLAMQEQTKDTPEDA